MPVVAETFDGEVLTAVLDGVVADGTLVAVELLTTRLAPLAVALEVFPDPAVARSRETLEELPIPALMLLLLAYDLSDPV